MVIETDADTFLIPHSQRTSKRMVPDIMGQLEIALHGVKIKYEGRDCEIRTFNPVKKDDTGEWELMFDVLNPSGEFEHLEFVIKNSGWERRIAPEEQQS